MRGIGAARAIVTVALATCLLSVVAVGSPPTTAALAAKRRTALAPVPPRLTHRRANRARVHRHGAPRRPRGSATSSPDVLVNLYDPGWSSYYAFVEEDVSARSRPSSSASIVTQLRQGTFWGTSEIVQALERTSTDGGWTRVRIPDPHDPIGWVPTSALSPLQVVHTWLQVNRESLTATLVREGRVIFSAPIGVGKPSTPTPEGEFFIEVSLTPTNIDGFYGPFAFGTSAHSATLTEWPNKGQIGVHGTNEPELIPGRVSHGCVRMLNEDILRLSKLMPVGTPVTIY